MITLGRPGLKPKNCLTVAHHFQDVHLDHDLGLGLVYGPDDFRGRRHLVGGIAHHDGVLGVHLSDLVHQQQGAQGGGNLPQVLFVVHIG